MDFGSWIPVFIDHWMFYSWYRTSKNQNQVFSIQYYIRYFVWTLVDRHDIHHVQVCSSHYQVLWTEILIFLESKSIALYETNPKRCLPNHQIVSIKYHFQVILDFLGQPVRENLS